MKFSIFVPALCFKIVSCFKNFYNGLFFFAVVIFQIGSCTFVQDQPQILLPVASHVARITRMGHHTQPGTTSSLAKICGTFLLPEKLCRESKWALSFSSSAACKDKKEVVKGQLPYDHMALHPFTLQGSGVQTRDGFPLLRGPGEEVGWIGAV
jgi:hypothetical protein